jgi:hypothetical protein
MRRQRDTIGNRRFWLGLLGVSALALLSGCGWFGGGSADSQKARPGVDRKVPATGALPSANPGQQHEAGVTATDPAATHQIGSIVPAKGGQKAQKEAAEKEANERDAKEREARQKREAEERDAKAKEPKEPPVKTTTAGSLPGKPAAAEPGNAEPAATRAPPTAPVTSAPIPPPSPAPAPAPASAPEQPAVPPRT